MTTISIKHLILSSTLSILLLSHSANGECVICPDGLEFPDALIPNDNDGSVTCTQGVSSFSSYDRNSCVATQVDVVPICCPSQFQTIAAGNICGWCENGTGIDTLETSFRGPLAGMGDATCADILPGIALATDTTGCSVYEYAEEYCCPSIPLQIDPIPDVDTEVRDDAPIGNIPVPPSTAGCHFCDSGIEFPSARPIKGDETSCQEAFNIFVQIKSALVGNEMACKSYRQLEYACCPDSINIANPVGNGDEKVAEDIVPKDEEEEDTTVEQSGQVTIDTEMDEAVVASVDDGSDGSTSGSRDGNVGDSPIISDVAAGDLIFSNGGGTGGGGVTVNKDATATKDATASAGEADNSGLDYDIIYPDEQSGGSLRQRTLLGSSSSSVCLIMSLAMAWLLQSL